jgi:hypothetical protein
MGSIDYDPCERIDASPEAEGGGCVEGRGFDCLKIVLGAHGD